MELFQASRQWATRPNDERFSSVQDAYQQALHYAKNSAEKENVDPSTLRVQASGEDVMLIGKKDVPVDLTNYAFGQLAAKVGAPAGYLRTLTPTLAAQNLNYGLANKFGTALAPNPDNNLVNILAHSNGKQVIRAITSDRYERVWNHEVLGRLLDFEQYGWKTPVAFEHANGQGWGQPNGQHEKTIYVSDHDMFVFLVNNEYRIHEVGNNAGLGRGFFVGNSEVGAASLTITTFMYRFICANHIVWGAKDVAKLSLRHVGDIRKRFHAFAAELTKYANSSASEDEAAIVSAQKTILGGTKDEVLDEVFSRLKGNISQKLITAGYDAAVQNEVTDGNPNSVWGMVNGLTRVSQETPFADERVRIDNAAAKLLAAF